MLIYFLKKIITYPKIALISTLAFCIILSFFSLKLQIDASADSLLLEDDKDLKIFREISKDYKSDDFLIIAFKPKDLDPFSKQSLEKLKKIHKDLENSYNVERVLSIINAPLLQSSDQTDLKELIKNIPNITFKDINLSKAKNEILNSPFYKNNIISKDGTTTALIIYLNPDLKLNQLLDQKYKANQSQKEKYQNQIQEHQNSQKIITKKSLDQIKHIMQNYQKNGDELYISGISLIAEDMISYIKDDLLIYGFALILLLSLALYYFFRSLRFVFLPLFICFISLSSASGVFALLGFKITVISSNYVALILIITLSVVIHLITHFIECSNKFPHAKIQNVILATLLAKAKPSFYAILTTMIGFLSLVFSNIEPIIKLGIMMSIGISLSLILSYLFLGSILALLKPKNYSKREFKFNFLNFCAKSSLNHRKLIYTLTFLASIFVLAGISFLRVENSFVNYFKDGSEIKKGLLLIDTKLGGTLPLDIIIKFKENSKFQNNDNLDSFENEFEALSNEKTYWFNAKKIRIVKKIHQYLENKPYIGSVLSLNSLLTLGKNINDGKDLDDFALAFLNENLPNDFKKDLLSPFVNIDKNELRFTMRIIDSDPNLRRNEFLKELNKELNELLKNDDVSVQIAGVMVLYNNMLQSLFSSQFNTLIFVILVIFILFILIFKDLKFSIIALVVNIIPISVVFALMGILNIPLDMMSITIAAISMGIGVDDAIHYIYRFKQTIKNKNIKEAILNTHNSIGSALYYTSISIILGFSVMMSSNFIPTIYFGALTIFVMILLLLGSLFLLPSLLITFKKNQ